MARAKLSGADENLATADIDPELHEILNAIFCFCLEGLQAENGLLRRDLFRLTEIEGQPIAKAASALDIDLRLAEQLLTQTQREIAVLMVLGLGNPACAKFTNGPSAADCFCSDS
tara:strand:- start:4753 stop:5097 length:345 start_codon:yes stop_codon:yes gene_type:complete